MLLASVFRQALPTSPQAFHDFQRVGNLVHESIGAKGPDKIEFEIRLGNMGNGTFDPGLSQEMYNRALKVVEGSLHWSDVRGVVEVEDAYYEHFGNIVRTRSMHSDRGVENTHITKDQIDKWTYLVEVDGAEAASPMALRIALNSETPVVPPDGAVLTTRYTISHLQSFDYTPSGYESSMMRLDFRETWAGTDRSKAELLQRSLPGKFSIEIEVIDNTLFSHKLGPSYVVLSLAVKLIDFLRYDNQKNTLGYNAIKLVSAS